MTYDRNVDLPTSGSPRMRMMTSGDGSESSMTESKCLEGREKLEFQGGSIAFSDLGMQMLGGADGRR